MKMGIIGGSGLDNPDLIKDYKEVEVETPYGKPSSKIITGKINNLDVCFLSRHGKNHEIPPTQVNYRANISAFAKLGVTHIIATTACGSLKQEIKRGDFVVLDQFIDFTCHRKITFFEEFLEGAKHTPMPDPFSEELRNQLINSAIELEIPYHKTGTVITIEGPRFSTRAESKMFKLWGADVINMSIAPEAILANEAGIKYCAIAMATDYDSWKENEEDVSWEQILKTFNQNSKKVKQLILTTIQNIANQEINQKDLDLIKDSIHSLPNWPKPGIIFRDINSLLQNPIAFQKTINILENRYKNKEIDKIAGIESRGFIIASILAQKLKKPLILIRKPGKLPFETISQEYELEYGTDKIEIQKHSISSGEKILVIDDLLATGGTAKAAANLIEKLEGKVVECSFIIELPDLKGKEKLKQWNVFSLVKFEGC